MRAGARRSVPKLCLRCKPFCHHCPSPLCGLCLAPPVMALAELRVGLCGHPHSQQERASRARRLRQRAQCFFLSRASAPHLRPAASRASGVACPSVAAAGLGLGLHSSETLAGGRVNTAHSGARGILLTALSSGLGGAAQARGGGPKARVVSRPCPRPPADCGASPAAKDSGRGCWRLSSL